MSLPLANAEPVPATQERAIRLKPRKDRPVRRGHPWIFSGAIAGLDPHIVPGAPVAVHSAEGEFLGRGYANPRCAITVRLLAHEDRPLDAAFFTDRVGAAVALRRTMLPAETDMYRLINAEGDFLPGVVADVYGAVIVLQCLTAGSARLKPQVVDALQAALAPGGVYERSDGGVRREEGLAPAHGVLAGSVPETPLPVRECGLRFLVDVRAGQKTGFFLDQRDNRALVRRLAAGRTVLNAFAYSGAFGVYAGAGGAREVVSVDSSQPALELARRHWSLNGLAGAAGAFVGADIFRYLRETDRRFELLILDPPALVRRRQDVAAGARAYKDLHLWAFRRAAAGGVVMTFSCSQHVPAELFWKIVHGAARDAHREVRVLRRLGPGADHPLNLAHPEGEYLKGMLLSVT